MDESEGRQRFSSALKAGNKAAALAIIKDNPYIIEYGITMWSALTYDCHLDVIWAILDAGVAKKSVSLRIVLNFVNIIYRNKLESIQAHQRCPAWNLMLAGFAFVECGADTRGLTDLTCPPMILEHATRCDVARPAAARANLVFYACLRRCRPEIRYLARYIAAFNCERLKWRNWI
jgi:hypothetical protein